MSASNHPEAGSRGATAARIVALVVLVVAVAVVAWILLSGSSGTDYRLIFQNAGQLVKGDDVQVGGRRIGSVKKIELTPTDQAQITITVGDEFAPLHEGTHATIRATSLSGIANRYVALTPGPNNAPKLDPDAVLTGDATTDIVDLDQLFNTLDARTVRGLQQVVQGSAIQYAGSTDASALSTSATPAARKEARRSAALSRKALLYFNPALSTTTRLINEVLLDQRTFTNFIISTSRVVTAVSQRRNALSSLVSNANTTTGAIAAENASFSRTLQQLPFTLRRANTTFVNLRATLNDLTVLVDASKPATKRLAALLIRLRPFIHDAIPTIHDLRVLVHQPGPFNDLTDQMLQLPSLAAEAERTFPRARQTIVKSIPVVTFIRPYSPDFTQWLRDFGEGANTYDANGHYARIQPIFNAYSEADNALGQQILTPISTADRLAGYGAIAHGTGNLRRCPGTASQAPPSGDNSTPFLDQGQTQCLPSEVLPGSGGTP